MFLYADDAAHTGKLPLFDNMLAASPAAVAAEVNEMFLHAGGGPG